MYMQFMSYKANRRVKVASLVSALQDSDAAKMLGGHYVIQKGNFAANYVMTTPFDMIFLSFAFTRAGHA